MVRPIAICKIGVDLTQKLCYNNIIKQEDIYMLKTIEKMEVAQPSLRAIAEALNVPQNRIYSVSKQPIPGMIYDAKVYNWDAITKFVSKRIGGDNAHQTLEDVINAALEIDASFASKDTRRRNVGSGASKSMIDIGDGTLVPTRKFAVELGDVVTMKNSTKVYTVVYKTDAAVVLQQKGLLALTSLSNWTFNQKAIKPAPAADVAE